MARWYGLDLDVPDGWSDTTQDAGPRAPPTLTREDGVGALQFSIAVYRSGQRPDATADALAAMLEDFAARKGLLDPIDRVTRASPPLVGATYRLAEKAVRAWYVSDGLSFALVTYLCGWRDRHTELDEVEEIVRSVRFAPSSAPPPPTGRRGSAGSAPGA
jgi:hypothetical protein